MTEEQSNPELPEGWYYTDNETFGEKYTNPLRYNIKKSFNYLKSLLSIPSIKKSKRGDRICLEDLIPQNSPVLGAITNEVVQEISSTDNTYNFDIDIAEVFKRKKKSKLKEKKEVSMEIFRPEQDEVYFKNKGDEKDDLSNIPGPFYGKKPQEWIAKEYIQEIKDLANEIGKVFNAKNTKENIKKKLVYGAIIGSSLGALVGISVISEKTYDKRQNKQEANLQEKSLENESNFILWGEAVNKINSQKSLEEITTLANQSDVKINSKLSSNVLYKADCDIEHNKIILKSTSRNNKYTTFNIIEDGKIIDYKKVKVGEEVVFNLPLNYKNLEITEHIRDENGNITQSYRFIPSKNSEESSLITPNSLEDKTLAQSPVIRDTSSLNGKLNLMDPIFLNAYDRVNYYDGNLSPLCPQDVFGKAEDISTEYNLTDSSKRNAYVKQVVGFNEEEVCRALNQTRKTGYNINYSASFYKNNHDATEEVVQVYKNSKSTKDALEKIKDSLNLNLNDKQMYSVLNIYKKIHEIDKRTSRDIF